MNVDCRFTAKCESYLTESCGECRHNRKRNGPKSMFLRANDNALKEWPKRGNSYMAIKRVNSYVTYICPACEETVDYCRISCADGRDLEVNCESCGLSVIVGF